MTTDFVLVDYENVQPKDLALLRGESYKVKLFLGASQAKIPVALAEAIQPLGGNAEYVVLESSGCNALDFHIAYYVGVLSTQDPAARFHIVSKDTGFDPLIKHLKATGVRAQRISSIATITPVSRTDPSVRDAQFRTAVTHLTKLKLAKPRTVKTLRSTLHALFKSSLSEEQLSELVVVLCERGVAKLDGVKVSYETSSKP